MVNANLPSNAPYPAGISDLKSATGPDGTTFFWADPSYHCNDMFDAQSNYAAPVARVGQTVLKQARQRFVFRHVIRETSFVYKLFPLSAISSRLRHRKYAYREFCNMRFAAKLGVPTPEAIAFLEKRNHFLVSCSGLIQQDLNTYTDLLAASRSQTIPYEVIMGYATQALCLLYDVGANHIDLRDENILVDFESDTWRIIDWQYASFVTPRAPWLLEYLVAFYIRLAPEDWRDQLLSEWVSDIHKISGHSDPFDAFDAKVKAIAAKRSRVRHRLALRELT